jgi:hypothetical protein
VLLEKAPRRLRPAVEQIKEEVARWQMVVVPVEMGAEQLKRAAVSIIPKTIKGLVFISKLFAMEPSAAHFNEPAYLNKTVCDFFNQD